jgi:hypothetical protein
MNRGAALAAKMLGREEREVLGVARATSWIIRRARDWRTDIAADTSGN